MKGQQERRRRKNSGAKKTNRTPEGIKKPSEVKRPGRPTKTPKPATRVSLGLKVTPDIKMQLDAAARESGRTQSQEAEKRLEQTFRDQSLLIEVLGGMFGKPLAMTLLTMGQAMKMSGQQAGWLDKHTSAAIDDWFYSPVAFDQAHEAATHLLERLRPAGDPEWTDKDPKYIELYENIGKKNVNSCIQALTGNLPSLKKIPVQAREYRSELDVWADDLKDTMGPLCDRGRRPIDTGWALETVIPKNPKGGQK